MKKLILLPVMLSLTIIGAAISAHAQNAGPSSSLVKLWETGPVFKVPESVCYDPAGQVLYVSNINGNPVEKDRNGFISKISLDGKMIAQEWATGLNAPKGMGISGNRLYVTDIDRIAQIDLESGKVLQFFDVPGAGFLNDIAVSSTGNVYISDMSGTAVYMISGGKLTLFLDDKMLSNPNGLFIEKQNLFIGCNKIVKVSLAGGVPEEWLTGTGSIDGLEGTGDGRFLFSDWLGNVFLVDGDRKIKKLLDLTTEQKNAADIRFIPSLKLLLVPTFGANTVAAFRLSN